MKHYPRESLWPTRRCNGKVISVGFLTGLLIVNIERIGVQNLVSALLCCFLRQGTLIEIFSLYPGVKWVL